MKRLHLFAFFLSLTACVYHKMEVVELPHVDQLHQRTLFFAMDGIGYDMMKELKGEGYFKDFRDPIPLIVTFPSATTTSFTGIFQPLHAGKVPGYEIRFYSYKKNGVIGGTPWEVYKIPIKYKDYFDYFRHTMFEKTVMYSFPGVAGTEDLTNTEKLILHNPKKVLMSYMGGTDGAQHVLGKRRVMRFMKYADGYIQRMKKKYATAHPNEPLRIVIFSDHGFQFGRLRMIFDSWIEKALVKGGLKMTNHLIGPNDVVPVEFGLLSAGALITQNDKKEKTARLIKNVKGIDLVFWPSLNQATKHKIHVINSKGEEAYFEYRGIVGDKINSYSYQTVKGDPLELNHLLKTHHHNVGEWISDKEWFALTSRHYYPDPGYRLYTAFHTLVQNQACVLFSTKPLYQFGSFAPLLATYLKFGHKGTHGALLWAPSAGVVMTDDPNIKLPSAIRYNEFFPLFIPGVTKAYDRMPPPVENTY